MSDPYLGQIALIGFSFAPKGYAWCDGQSLPIAQNAALFSLLSIQFGGDGRNVFKVPDLRGRVPVHPDNDVSDQGDMYGMEQVTLSLSTMAYHTHGFVGTTSEGDRPLPSPSGAKILAKAELYGATTEPQDIYGQPPVDLISLNPNTMTLTGGGQSHNNIQPSLVIGFVIALQGLYPSRN